ncbi:Hsp20/alpha crystallin family protein [Flavitalea sp.]|nr:Hsp20/alpha crystallin family protein [Flavitalea sp.]
MTFVKINNRPVKTFDTIFDELFNGAQSQWSNGQKSGSVPVNILESKDGYHLEFNAAGRNKEDFKVEVEKGLLTISFEAKETETKEEDYKTVRKEFTISSFKRSFNVDDKVNVDNIQAKYENGVLKVYLPKKEEIAQAGKQISVQ